MGKERKIKNPVSDLLLEQSKGICSIESLTDNHEGTQESPKVTQDYDTEEARERARGQRVKSDKV